MNRARQAAITKELMDIVGGAEALRDRIADDERRKGDKDGKEHGGRRPEGADRAWGEGNPFYGAAETVAGEGTHLRRQGTPFWEHLDEAGVPTTFYDLPCNYPPSPSAHGHNRCLSGMGTLIQGSIESSNVNVVEELVNMIETQQAYEMNSRAVQTTDQMMTYATQNM